MSSDGFEFRSPQSHSLSCILHSHVFVALAAIDCIGDPIALLEGGHVFLRQACACDLVPDGDPVVVKVVLAPEDLQILPYSTALKYLGPLGIAANQDGTRQGILSPAHEILILTIVLQDKLPCALDAIDCDSFSMLGRFC